jgi:hypothetical protein
MKPRVDIADIADIRVRGLAAFLADEATTVQSIL